MYKCSIMSMFYPLVASTRPAHLPFVSGWNGARLGSRGLEKTGLSVSSVSGPRMLYLLRTFICF